ncbi:MAG: LysR family transcriptional regulator [Chromatiales bacterium]
MRVTLRQLQTFEAVARLKSFSGAAGEMQVTHSVLFFRNILESISAWRC